MEQSDAKVIHWLSRRLRATGLGPKLGKDGAAWSGQPPISDFSTKGGLVVFFSSSAGCAPLVASGTVPDVSEVAAGSKLVYFVSPRVSEPSAVDLSKIVWGETAANAVENLYRLMRGVYQPALSTNVSWPESTKREFRSHLHRFMASLTETAHIVRGRTVLYVPDEPISSAEEALANKDLVQTLEATLIHWTRQIKEAIANQENAELADNAGPLAELEFWQSKAADLSSIRDQITDPRVRVVVQVLQAAKSSYVDQFVSLSDLIKQGSLEAQDNLSFLSLLQQPCELLARAEPRGIPELLPRILHTVRFIGAHSKFYGTQERIAGLLTKVSNEIINRCAAKISLEGVFDGDVDAAMLDLSDSVAAMGAWRRAYAMERLCTARAGKGKGVWEFADTGIFAYVDAFVKRCRDLLEVCEGQVQFARKQGAAKARVPSFGGASGPDIMKGLVEIERAFDKQVHQLRSVGYSILDVKATRWHDDFSAFLRAANDLELMTQNLISSAFEGAVTVAAGVELVAIFRGLARREGIARTVEKKAAEVLAKFVEDLGHVKEAFEHGRKQPPVNRLHPPMAGAALWALSLKQRVAHQWALFPANFAPGSDIRAEAQAEFAKLSSALDDYIDRTHARWAGAVQDAAGLAAQLDTPVMLRDEATGFLECNFSRDVAVLLNEVYYWKMIGRAVPEAAEDLYARRDALRMMRESVLEVVRRNNAILRKLSAEERGLFRERLEYLSATLLPGVESLPWSQADAVSDFVARCTEHAGDVNKIVTEFKDAAARVLERADSIATLQFFSVRKKTCYRSTDFVEKQVSHRNKARAALASTHAEVVHLMTRCHETFRGDSEDIQREWSAFLGKVDDTVGAKLLLAIRNSLHELERAIVGDEGKTEAQPILQVNASLEQTGVVFRPTIPELVATVVAQAREIVDVARTVPRLSTVVQPLSPPVPAAASKPEQSAEEPATSSSSASAAAAPVVPAPAPGAFIEIVRKDGEVASTIGAIEAAMNAPEAASHEYVAMWEKNYKPVWEENKDAFIRRYSKPVRPLAKFEEDIRHYAELATEIERAEAITPIGYVLVDCSPLKAALIGECNQWQARFTGLLGQLAAKELHSLQDTFEDVTRRLRAPPRTLEALKSSVDLLEEMVGEQPKIEARFEPLEAMYKLLKRSDVQVDPAELSLKDGLPAAWAAFKQALVEADGMVKQKKEKFKADLVKSMKDFGATVTKAREEFIQKGPTTSNIAIEKAFRLIAEFRSHMDRIAEKEAQLKAGLEVFQMEVPVNKELAATQKDLENLEHVWQLTEEWNKTWDEWRSVRFSEINVAKMEEEAQRFQKKLIKLGKDIKGMEVWATLKERIDQVAAGMPLITDLKNPALRARHWERLKEEVGKSFDPTSPMFTLDTVFALGFDNFADVIGTISVSATKELAIEQTLKDIEEKWNGLNLDIVAHKETGHKLRSCEDVFQALEDHKVVLSDMKASHYFFAFEAVVERWERTLSHILETLEVVLKVQRLWLYLESIFTATEDIRRQLPAESAVFEKVDHTWRSIMDKMSREPNALRATSIDGALESLNDMNAKLEKIQHSLNQYLESKRRVFPRFYFISDRDLLEILGQTKDPTAVQRHLIKIFDNINQLEFVQSKDKKRFEAVRMSSTDGEDVAFVQPVPCEGGVENWLQVLEEHMQKTLTKELYQAILGFSKFRKDKPAKQERFLRATPGQLVLAASEIAWTQNTAHALSEIEGGSNRAALTELRKRQAGMLHVLSEMVRSQLPPLSRLKLVALLTIEIHHRDVLERLARDGVSSERDFGWRSQLRFYWEKEEEEAVIRQTDFQFQYGYEYLGNTGRLVITPLTEKVYLSLTTALMLKKGSNPQGPAGTGKTETVRDLAKALAKFCVVMNSSDSVDVQSMARSLVGMASSGSWSCFDEFNRIDTQVLSVVAIQISSILSAIAAGKRRFVFPMYEEIVLKPGAGVFVTMNPGYAGRSELPDNLKSLFRPVIMWTPDSSMIAEIMLFSEGFKATKVLSRKIVTLFQLCSQQLSKQDHYDFTLRSIKSVLVTAGALKRKDPDTPEELLLLRALRDMNLPKFVGEDIQLFLGITAVLFPGIEVPEATSTALQQAIEAEIQEQGLQVHPALVRKAVQLYDTKRTRHGTMIVGKSLSGKCLSPDTPVLFADGRSVRADEISAGDFLVGEDGTARVVLSTTRGFGPLFRVRPSGESLEDGFVCNDQHLLVFEPASRPCIDQTPHGGFRVWWPGQRSPLATVGALSKSFRVRRPGDRERQGVDYFDARAAAEQAAKQFHEQKCAEFDSHPPSFTIQCAGLHGVSNGAVDSRFYQAFRRPVDHFPLEFDLQAKIQRHLDELGLATTQVKDIDLARFIGLSIGDGNEHSECDDSPVYSFMCKGAADKNAICRIAKELGAIRNIPSQLLSAPRPVRLHLLSGIIDADGYYATQDCRYEIIQKRKELSYQIVALARGLGLRASVHPEKASAHPGNEYFRVCISGQRLSEIPVLLSSKKAPVQVGARNELQYGVEIEKLEEGEFVGFTLGMFDSGEAFEDYIGAKREPMATDDDLEILRQVMLEEGRIVMADERGSAAKDGRYPGRFLLGDYTVTHNTTCWKVLAGAMTRLCKREKLPGFNCVKATVINPRALALEELYGCYDPKTHEWSEGIVSTIMRNSSADTKPDEKWLVFDGPVDTLWIESMNSVLDDNRVLTPVNGERIFLAPQVSLLFEVEDLRQASPATVSRCGMIYMEQDAIGWRPYVESWIQRLPEAECRDHLRGLFNKYVQQALDYRARECTEIVHVSDTHAVISLCNLYEAVATPENGVNVADADFYLRMVELWFLFSLIWSIGAAVTEESRKKMDMFLREIEGQFPRKDTVYEYVVDPQRKGWAMWEEKLPPGWRYQPKDPFHKIFVPTIDTLRNSFIVSSLVRAHKHVLLVGNSGTGKTAIAQNVLAGPVREQFGVVSLNFSARTTSHRLQEFVEGYVDKRTMYVFVPRGGKRMVVFIDDLNMPRKDAFGTQPPLELLRQWVDYGFWYDRKNITPNNIKDMQLVCAMAPPGGGRNEISPRLLSRFNVINVTFPEEPQIKRIFGTMVNQKLQSFEEEVKPLGDLMTQATWEVYQAVTTTLLPTPTRMHYVFNLRDMSKVFQGLLQANPDRFNTAESMAKLWVHEVMRVFSDRLVDDEGRQWFQALVSDKLGAIFGLQWAKIFRDPRATPLFTELANPDDPVYQEQPDIEVVRRALEAALEEYVVTAPMDLVLFNDAIRHVCRIHRIIKQPRGNALLIGMGGSGRQSLARLASFAAGMKLFTVDVRKGFRESDFRDKLKELYYQTGIEEKPTVFLFSDVQILRTGFLEDISSILSSGEVPNLYTADEYASVCDALKSTLEASGSKQVRGDRDSLYQQLIERARNNIHVVLLMSPVGEKFRNWCRMFPAIINNTSIDWFSEWPSDALREVATKCLSSPSPSGGTAKRPAALPAAAAAAAAAASSNPEAAKQKQEEEKARQTVQHEVNEAIASVCQGAHSLAVSLSAKMAAELKRTNHVTPSNFLGLLRSYRELYDKKRAYLESEAVKLENGLKKLDDTRQSVASMGEKLREMQKQGARLQRECDEALVVIVQQKQEASDQARVIEQQEAKLTKEEQEIREERSKAKAELDKAMPAFEAAKKALKSLDRRDLGEIRTYVTPLPLTAKVMEAVMVLRATADTSWAEAKKQLADIQFIPQLLNYEIEGVSDAMLKKIDKYVIDPDFRPEKVQRESAACMSLCTWVIAVDKCAHAQREVAPKQQALAVAQASLEKNAKALEEARANLKAINEKLDVLRADHAAKVMEKDKLAAEASETEVKINRASRLVEGLASERARWEGLIGKYKQELGQLAGNCIIAAVFMSYAGPFPHSYRLELMSEHAKSITKLVAEAKIPFTPELPVTSFIADRVDVREWTSHGLPNDEYSIQNGMLVMPPTKWVPRSRWPLIIDPEGQANKWIKATEGGRNLRIVGPNQDDFMRTVENAVQFGLPVLLEDVGPELDPSLDPILTRRLVRLGSREVLRLDDGKEIEYHPDFRLYVTTKLANPGFGPELTTKMTVVNFAVREQGLQQQLLGHVVLHERRQLEEQKAALVAKIAGAQRTLSELEDRILHLLSSSTGSLLDDEVLVTALETAKTTSEDMKQQLAVSEKTEVKIDNARQAFQPCAVRAAVLFFVLKDLAAVDTMYQFSLDSYTALFSRSLASSPESEDLQERIRALNEYHTLNVYRTTCRALFEQHKPLFAFQLCVKILESEKKLNRDEYQFLLRGGSGNSASKDAQLPNPCPDWLPEHVWEHLVVLDRLHGFKNFASSFEQNGRDWREWFLKPEPESVPLPGEWENRCNELQHLLLVRSFRPDRLGSAVSSFISSNLGARFTEPPPFDPRAALDDSAPLTPLLFVLSPGVDPLGTVSALAASRGLGPDRFTYHPLGQGQEARAVQLIEEASREGRWVFLSNLDLMISWAPKLEKILDDIAARGPGAVNGQFRLWLSSRPHPQFPITLLQRSVKITTQPPKGIKQNLLRILKSHMTEQSFSGRPHATGQRYRKLAFSLAFLHSVLLERSKFLSLGFNTVYDFNDADFGVSDLLLSKLLEEYEGVASPAPAATSAGALPASSQQPGGQQPQSQQPQQPGQLVAAGGQQQPQQPTSEDGVPWQALRYIIAEINYGGRVTDRWDMHLLSVYARKFFCPEVLAQQNFRLSGLPTYYVPEDGPLQSFIDYVGSLPHVDKPEAFGQHPNADIASQIQEGTNLLSSLLSLQPRTAPAATGSGGAVVTREQRLLALIADLLKRLPAENIDSKLVTKLRKEDPAGNPLLTVLSHEIARYNRLLDTIRLSLQTLKKGLLGLVVMSSELDEMASCLFDSRVPQVWRTVYPSQRSLFAWVTDLLARVDMFSNWAQDRQPAVFWLGGFTFPTGFLTALLQKFSLKNNVSIDTLGWEFSFLREPASSIREPPADGAYIAGMILEGAGWDDVAGYLREPAPMELDVPMPVVHFRPVELKRKQARDPATIYQCPCYLWPVRDNSNREKPSYMLTMEVPSGKEKPDYWTLRGTAVLLSK